MCWQFILFVNTPHLWMATYEMSCYFIDIFMIFTQILILKNIHKWNNSYKSVTILWSDVLQSRGDLKLTEKQRHTFYLSFLFFCAIFLSKKRCSKKRNFLSFTGTKMTRSFMYTNMHSQHGCSKRAWKKNTNLKKVGQRKWDFT